MRVEPSNLQGHSDGGPADKGVLLLLSVPLPSPPLFSSTLQNHEHFTASEVEKPAPGSEEDFGGFLWGCGSEAWGSLGGNKATTGFVPQHNSHV